MSGFGNIGTGLAGFMQGYQNSQREAAQRALQQQALDQILRSNLASRLLGASSLFGGGIGNPTPQPSMPGTPSVPTFPQGGGGGAPPIPPAPAAPPPVPQAPVDPDPRVYDAHPVYATPGQPQPFGDDTPIPPPPMQGEMVDARRMIGRETLAPPDSPQQAGDAPAPGGLQKPLSEEEYQRQYPDGIIGPPGGFHTPAGSATTAPTPSGSAGSGGGAEQAPAAGGSPANSSLFQQLLDPNHAYKALGEMRDRIAASAPPGTDPAVIWEATQQLYKLTNGGATERAQLAAYLKMAGLDVKQSEGAANRGSREGIAAAGRGSREGIAAAGREAAGQRQERGLAAGQNKEEFRQGRIDARQALNIVERRRREAQANSDKQLDLQLKEIQKQISAQGQIISNAPAGSSAQKTAMQRLQELADEAKKLGPSGTVAPPTPAPPQ